MCMKSINITSIFVEDDFNNVADGFVYDRRLTKIKTEKNSNGENTIKLNIITFFNAMSFDEDEKLEKKYDIMWTFGYMDSEGDFNNKVLGTAIFDTSIEKIDISQVSKKVFTNQSKRIIYNHYVIDEIGTYYLKVYIRETGSDGWQIQAINQIEVCE